MSSVCILSHSQTNLNKNQISQRDVSVQTILSASTTTNVSSDWLFKTVDQNDVDMDFLSEKSCVSDTEQLPDSETPKPQRQRRKRIPDKPYHSLGLWSILKDLIGQNLSTVALPVNFNEPLTVLQRMTESFQYTDLLDRAADCENVYDQIAYLAAFSITGYAPSAQRTGKPFNPLLGETYECDRTNDLGWKCILEQVSHHPSISALHCESEKWIWWENLAGNMQFRGRYIKIAPADYRYVRFKRNQKTYRLERAETIVHNIVFGKIWIDHCGNVDIVCLDDTVKCSLMYTPYSSFSRGPQRKVNGEVTDGTKVKRLIRGFWNERVEIDFDVNESSEIGSPENSSYEVVWKRKPLPPESSYYYHFSEFTCELNEFESGVAPTDSRLRPDLRLMEEGNWDEANKMKLRLEEKQRQVKYQRETEQAALLVGGSPINPYQPSWFVETKIAPTAGVEQLIYVYNGGYWEAKEKGDWSACPDIFL